jgi:signal transduction histidine kinase
MRVIRALAQLSLAARFRLASFVVLVLGLIGIGSWLHQQIEASILHGTSATTALYVESFVAPQLTDLLLGQPVSEAHLATLARLLSDSPLSRQIVAFKVWGTDGFVLFDTDASSIGRTFPVEPRLAQAWLGTTTTRLSNLEAEENASERLLSEQLMETYTPVRMHDSGPVIAVAEFYQRVDTLKQDIAAAQRSSWLVITAAMVIIYLLLIGFVQRASDLIRSQQGELTAQVGKLQDLLAQNRELSERVRLAAAGTADVHERVLRRVSAELHDGPAQDLSLALLQMDPEQDETAGEAADPCDARLRPLQEVVSHALNEVRAISSGLGLPELAAMTLGDVVRRVVRNHERRTGTSVSLDAIGLPSDAPQAVKITTYRVIQEALNNAYHHAGGAGQAVRAEVRNGWLELEVRDGGPGFDAEAVQTSGEHLGLLGMRERVWSLGGRFSLTSRPGLGTVVRASLELGTLEESNDR